MDERILYTVAGAVGQAEHASVCLRESHVIPVYLSGDDAVVRAADAGLGFARTATDELRLVEALEFWASRPTVVLDLRDRGLARPVLGCIHRLIFSHRWNYSQFLVCSSKLSELMVIADRDRHVRIGMVSESSLHGLAHIGREIGAYCAVAPLASITANTCRVCHEHGLMVFADNTNEPAHMDALHTMGVDGFVSSREHAVYGWLAARQGQVTAEAGRRDRRVHAMATRPVEGVAVR